MTNDGSVLVVSTVVDSATDEVIRQLAALSVPCVRLNTEDFPFGRSITVSHGPVTNGALTIDGVPLSAPSAVWYRRLRSAAKPDTMDDGVYDFCLRENRATILGGLLGLNSRWMSHPASIWQAENKPYQLTVAQQVGLRVPKTVITNDTEAIRSAAASFGRMIVKPARTGHLVQGGVDRAIFTTELTRSDLKDLQGAELSPAIYQELVPKRFDIRATLVGRQIFAARIDSQSDVAAEIDWRHTSNPDLPHARVTLPTALQQRLHKLMDRLGLEFAAIDLVETPEGEFVFLEVNPNGQWLWLDDKLELGISTAVAAWLAGPR